MQSSNDRSEEIGSLQEECSDLQRKYDKLFHTARAMREAQKKRDSTVVFSGVAIEQLIETSWKLEQELDALLGES